MYRRLLWKCLCLEEDESEQRNKKVVLAYSGGLDSSVIVRWLIETYGCEVITLTGDVGQKQELEGLEKRRLPQARSRHMWKT